jgi:hypothetical protein
MASGQPAKWLQPHAGSSQLRTLSASAFAWYARAGYRLRYCPVGGCYQARPAMASEMWSDQSDHAETDRQHESVLGTGLRSDGARGVQQVECLKVKAKTGG